jgi:hypothetical protein
MCQIVALFVEVCPVSPDIAGILPVDLEQIARDQAQRVDAPEKIRVGCTLGRQVGFVGLQL